MSNAKLRKLPKPPQPVASSPQAVASPPKSVPATPATRAATEAQVALGHLVQILNQVPLGLMRGAQVLQYLQIIERELMARAAVAANQAPNAPATPDQH